MSQLIFSLPYPCDFKKENFLRSLCNAEAFAWCEQPDKWPTAVSCLYGPAGCGKTFLAHLFSSDIWTADNLPEKGILPKKCVIEDIDKNADEVGLFHFFNNAVEQGCHLLLTAQTVPHFQLPDLASRINSIPKIAISPPDDDLLFGVLYKAFCDKQIQVDPKVLTYAITHMPRTFEALHLLIAKADNLSLSAQRPVTIAIIKEALQSLFSGILNN